MADGNRSPGLVAPFPWPGGKRRAASLVWGALGNPAVYVEPFAGSCAVLLQRPDAPRVEVVNDLDGFVANFWRAVAADPAAVARAADWPVNETDLHAWHRHLVGLRADLVAALDADPRAFDAEVAGRWAWGLCQWIGHGWCASDAPGRQLPRLSTANGLCRLAWSQSNAINGEGVVFRSVREWIEALQVRLRNVRVTCGDWRRVVTGGVIESPLRNGYPAGSVAGVFLDPPYADGAQQYAAGGTGSTLSADVRAWAIANGDRPDLRIVLAGYDGEHAMPASWRCVEWKAKGGYGNASGNANRLRERLWLSPACLDATRQRSLFAGASS